MISLAMLFKGSTCPRPKRQREEKCDRYIYMPQIRLRGAAFAGTGERERDVMTGGGGLGEGQGVGYVCR
jgi:hypothetical protein